MASGRGRSAAGARWQGGPLMSDQPSARGIRLRDVLPEARLHGATDVCVTSCTADWRTCRPGDVFVLLDEEGPNGKSNAGENRQRLEMALARGAAAVVAEPGIDELNVPTCLVADSRIALGEICQALAAYPSQSLNVVGITGARGKTITSHLISGVLS